MGLTITPLHWLIVFVILLVTEVITMGLTTIWFAGGALAALVVCVLGGSFWIQIIAFLVMSAILLVITRPFALKYINRGHVKTNVSEIPGTEGIVLEEIDNLKNTGKVLIKGMEWTARTADAKERIPKEKIIEVMEVSGVKVIVRVKQEV